MVEHALAGVPDIPTAAAELLHTDLNHPSGLMGTVGDTTIPGDTDSTACAILAARILGLPAPPSSTKIDQLYDPDQGCYRTLLFEHNGSLSTNIHVDAVLALVLEWLTDAMTREGTPLCKWHLSPIYAMGELARVTATISHPLATGLHSMATAQLLALHNTDGGWGAHGSTAEETGYAVLGLAAAPIPLAPSPTLSGTHIATSMRGPPREIPLGLGRHSTA
ncbi:hypothetical protein [Amycolatopsis alba]|uniref:Squalene cyclase C-terminal domain-containing protein n=1 Tax=Amycolatopsis alba DSM 44262 TaxID=1125972 RepID=A0A229R914_AMYAL|nr:hypothetical protein [Amycolatopsis alba]OXM43162.1 hypothetical protein CFP75_39875 [Amycolatopsis alba DSM 44262]